MHDNYKMQGLVLFYLLFIYFFFIFFIFFFIIFFLFFLLGVGGKEGEVEWVLHVINFIILISSSVMGWKFLHECNLTVKCS